MMLSTPSTQGLADTQVSQIDAALEHTTPFLPKGFTHVLSKVQAGVQVLLYKYAGWMLLQMFVEHASTEETVVLGKKIRPLVELGRQLGVGDPLSASRAELVVNVTVLVQSGTLPAGSQLLFPATGVLYLTTASVALNAPTVQVTVRASSDQEGGGGEGAIGNLQPGAIVQFANPLANIARNATVLSQSVTGANAEDMHTTYRARVRRRAQNKPQGGALADYRQWSEEATGILHVYPYTGDPGEVDVYVEATVDSSPDGIPTEAQRAAVLALIDADESGLATRRPANAAVNVLPITRQVFDVVVVGLEADDEPAAEAAIEQAVDEYLRSREPFIVGLSVLPRQDRITLAAVSGIVDDVVSALGATISSVRLLLDGEAIPADTLAKGEKAKLGTLSFE